MIFREQRISGEWFVFDRRMLTISMPAVEERSERLCFADVASGPDLLAAKRRAGLTGGSIATAFGVSTATVSRWLNRRDCVPSRYVLRLSRMLGVTIDDILPPDDLDIPKFLTKLET